MNLKNVNHDLIWRIMGWLSKKKKERNPTIFH